MKRMLLRSFWMAAVIAVATLSAAGSARGAEPTAFSLIKEGNRYIGEQSKDQVVQIRSDKSVGGLTPAIWYVVYRDETATMKTVEVKFGGGKMMGVKRPLRLIEGIGEKNEPLPAKSLKVDSDKALKTATKEPVLEKLTLTATQMRLEEYSATPTWKIKLWAAKTSNAKKSVDIGEIFVAADSGKVVKLDVNINKVD